jgi:hypothetical protein
VAYEKNPDELGVLWQKQSSAGNTFLSGKVTCAVCSHEQPVVVFGAKQPKKNDKAPDWTVMKSKPREDMPAPQPRVLPAQTAMLDDSEIPFMWMVPFLVPVFAGSLAVRLLLA